MPHSHADQLKRLKSLYDQQAFTDFKAGCTALCSDQPAPYPVTAYCHQLCTQLAAHQQQDHLLTPHRTFAIITINYNHLNGLRRTVESVTQQTARPHIQYIIIDGHSSDGSLDYLHEIAPDIDLITYGKDKGIYDAMNRGLQLVNADYTLFMNAGDTFDSPEVVAQVATELTQLPKPPAVIYGNTRWENDAVWKALLPPQSLWKGNIFCHQSVFINSTALKQHPFNLTTRISADFEQFYQLYRQGYTFHALKYTVAHVEDFSTADDFKARTLERWTIVRSDLPAGINLETVDAFYHSLLALDKPTSAHTHAPQKPMPPIINPEGEAVQKRVIFLISMPRSGSTLLQKMLEQSTEIAATDEPWVMLPLLGMYHNELVSAKYSQPLAIDAKNNLQVAFDNGNLIPRAQQQYADTLYSALLDKLGKHYFLDKTPRYIHILDDLIQLYPQAKFIVLLRNPAAIITSYAHSWFDGQYPHIMADPYTRYDMEQGFSRLADFIHSDFSNKTILHYEDLVSQPESTLKRVFDYLELDFNPEYVEYNRSGQLVGQSYLGDPYAVYAKQRPDPAMADNWLNKLAQDNDLPGFRTILNQIPDTVIQQLGYDKQEITSRLAKAMRLPPLELPPLSERFGTNNQVIANLQYSKPRNRTPTRSIGVLITCHNNENSIAAAITSVAEQSQPPALILIADDASGDESLAIIKHSITRYPHLNIELLARPENMGVAANRDQAIRSMEVDYITTLDGDDLFYPGKLEAEYLSLQGSMERVAFSDILLIDAKQTLRQDTSPYSAVNQQDLLQQLLTRSAPVPRDMLFPKPLFLTAQGFDTDMPLYEDWAFKMRLMLATTQGGWIHSGALGTVYDRRNPGLSSRDPIYHAYGQLFAMARNIDLLAGKPAWIAGGLVTVARHLKGEIQQSLLRRVKQLSEGHIEPALLKKLQTFCHPPLWRVEEQIVQHALREFGR